MMVLMIMIMINILIIIMIMNLIRRDGGACLPGGFGGGPCPESWDKVNSHRHRQKWLSVNYNQARTGAMPAQADLLV